MKPRVGISRCLLGDDVRYDGTNRRSSAVLAVSAAVDWVPVCPEVEVGMGVPREPIRLIARPGGTPSAAELVELRGVASDRDWTNEMREWARQRASDLVPERISGFVLKARSPSCGPAGVLVHHDASEPTATGRGLFAEALAAAIPGLPMIDEEALDDPVRRAEFMRHVQAFAGSAGTNT